MDRYHIICDPQRGTFAQRLEHLNHQVTHYLEQEQEQGRHLQYTKVFLSDAANQQQPLLQSPLWTDSLATQAHTIIQQSPVGGAKIALLLKTTDEPTTFTLHSMRLTDEEAANHGSYVQTIMLFDKYIAYLRQQGLELKTHCVRTWIYVRDIDTNYAGVVQARNDIFKQHGLTIDTHFIASTGIGGRTDSRQAHVAIDFLTYPDIKEEDKLYLQALDHLNPTHEYGVAFERGTRLTLPGKQTFFISGTASINNKGEVIHVGDVEQQTLRLLENIEALLADGGANMSHVCYFIVYLRDIADAPTIEAFMRQQFPTTPFIITNAKVCRPTWLIEMECIAQRYS